LHHTISGTQKANIMKASNFPVNVQKALLESLSNQTSLMTSSEVELLNELMELHPIALTGNAAGYERKGNQVRMVSMDTFGERYNNCWIKIYTSSKGEFFTHAYTGGKRVYID
jgi:hypothetical protein